MYNEESVRRFYRFLGHKRETEVRIIPARGGRPSSHFARTENKFHHICKRYNGKAHVYAGINERCGRGTGSKDVAFLNNVVLDIDVDTPDGCGATRDEMKQAINTATKVWNWVTVQSLHPHPVRIGSGNGCYLWLCVPRVALRGRRHRRAVRGKLKQFAEDMAAMLDHGNISVDPKVTPDLARIIRVPGTRNIKGIDCGDPDRNEGRYAFEIDPLYRVEGRGVLDFIERYQVEPPPAGGENMEPPEFEEPGDELLKTLYEACPRMRGLAGGGGEGEQSELADYHTWLYFGANLVKLAGDEGAAEWERVSRQVPGYNPDDFDVTHPGNKVTEIMERFEGVPGCESLDCPLYGTNKACGVHTPIGIVWRKLKGGGGHSASGHVIDQLYHSVLASLDLDDLSDAARAAEQARINADNKDDEDRARAEYEAAISQMESRLADHHST